MQHIAFWQIYKDVYRGLNTSEAYSMLKTTYQGVELLAYRPVPMDLVVDFEKFQMSC